jgi:hypothetical protein
LCVQAADQLAEARGAGAPAAMELSVFNKSGKKANYAVS